MMMGKFGPRRSDLFNRTNIIGKDDKGEKEKSKKAYDQLAKLRTFVKEKSTEYDEEIRKRLFLNGSDRVFNMCEAETQQEMARTKEILPKFPFEHLLNIESDCYQVNHAKVIKDLARECAKASLDGEDRKLLESLTKEKQRNSRRTFASTTEYISKFIQNEEWKGLYKLMTWKELVTFIIKYVNDVKKGKQKSQLKDSNHQSLAPEVTVSEDPYTETLITLMIWLWGEHILIRCDKLHIFSAHYLNAQRTGPAPITSASSKRCAKRIFSRYIDNVSLCASIFEYWEMIWGSFVFHFTRTHEGVKKKRWCKSFTTLLRGYRERVKILVHAVVLEPDKMLQLQNLEVNDELMRGEIMIKKRKGNHITDNMIHEHIRTFERPEEAFRELNLAPELREKIVQQANDPKYLANWMLGKGKAYQKGMGFSVHDVIIEQDEKERDERKANADIREGFDGKLDDSDEPLVLVPQVVRVQPQYKFKFDDKIPSQVQEERIVPQSVRK